MAAPGHRRREQNTRRQLVGIEVVHCGMVQTTSMFLKHGLAEIAEDLPGLRPPAVSAALGIAAEVHIQVHEGYRGEEHGGFRVLAERALGLVWEAVEDGRPRPFLRSWAAGERNVFIPEVIQTKERRTFNELLLSGVPQSKEVAASCEQQLTPFEAEHTMAV